MSSFFYGYPVTQIPGGYLSDRIGGDIMIYYAGIFWASATLLLPYVGILSDNKYYILSYITLFRCLTGGFQGKFFVLLFIYSFNSSIQLLSSHIKDFTIRVQVVSFRSELLRANVHLHLVSSLQDSI